MAIQVAGTLLDPLGAVAPDVVIRFTSLTSTDNTPRSIEGEYTTRNNGTYLFNLENGQHLLEILFTDTYSVVAEVIVDEATPTPIDLIGLIGYSTPVTPPVVDPTPPDWSDLYTRLRNAVDTDNRELREQIRDGNTYVSDLKQLVTNDRLAAEISEEVQSVFVDGAQLTTEKNAYADGILNEATIDRTVQRTRNATVTKTDELTESSAGVVGILSEREATADDVTVKDSLEANPNLVTMDREATFPSTGTGFTDKASIAKDASDDVTVTNTSTFKASNAGRTVEGTRKDEASTTYTDSSGTKIDQPRILVEDEATLTYPSGSGTMKDTQELLVNNIDQLKGTIERNIDMYGREAFERLENDGSIAKITKQANIISFVGTDGQELAELDTDANTFTVKGRLIVTNPDDFKGDPGDTIYLEFRYNTTKAAPEDPSWTPDFDPAIHTWRQHREVRGTTAAPIYGAWSEGYKLTAEDGLPGDTIYVEYMYSRNNSDPNTSPGWHSTMEEDDIWRTERVVELGKPIPAWASPVRIRGFDGTDGVITSIHYQYSIEAIPGVPNDPSVFWHDNFSTGDHWRRERWEFFATEGDYQAGVPTEVGPWLNVTQIVPIDGVDYGIKQTTVFLFQRASTLPAAPSGDLTYSFSNLTLTPISDLNGWTQDIPSGSGSIWIAMAVATTTTDTAVLSPSDWNRQLWASAGYNSARIMLYQRGSTTPPAPDTTLTWDFNLRRFTNPASELDGWEYAIPTGSGQVYVCIASAYSSALQDDVLPNEWQVGSQGIVGLNQANVVIYNRGATQPANPTGIQTYDFVNGTLTGLTGGWTTDLTTLPANGTPLWIGTASAISYDATDDIAGTEWQVSQFSEDGLQAATVTIYKTSDTNPAPTPPTGMPVDGTTYNYDTGEVIFVGANGWTETPPANAQGRIWVSQARVINPATTVTATIAQDDWAAPELFVEDGFQSSNVFLYATTDFNAAAPAANTVDMVWNFATQKFTTTPSSPWVTEYPQNHKGVVWFQRSVARALVTAATDTIPAAEFSVPEVYIQDGRTLVTVNLFAVNEPNKFSGECWYDTTNGVATFPDDAGTKWSSLRPSLNPGDTLYHTAASKIAPDKNAIVIFQDSEFPTPDTEFTAPVDGEGGAGFYTLRNLNNAHFNSDGTYKWDDDAAVDYLESTFSAVFGKSNVLFDVVSALGADDKNADAGILEAIGIDRGDWSQVAQYVHGNLVVDGSIRTKHLAANSVTGGEISSRTTVIAGQDRTNVDAISITVGNSGSNYGFARNQFGSISPLYFRGALINQLVSTPSATVLLMNLGDPSSKSVVYAQVEGSGVITMVWEESNKRFVSYSDVLFKAGQVGRTITFWHSDTSFSSASIAGMNGFDDGSGTGTDGIGFWAGETPNRAHAAPFRVKRDGSMFATSADIGGIIRADELIFNVPDAIPPEIDNGNTARTYRQPDAPTGTIPTGSIWYDTDDDNKAHRYNGTVWQAVDDLNKIQTYFQNNAPTGQIKTGSIWYDTDDGNKPYRWTGTQWTSAEDLNKVQTYYQDDKPTGNILLGSLWFDTNDNNKVYRYMGSGWVSAEDLNKISVYAQGTEPTGNIIEGSIWYDTDDNNRSYIYRSGSWTEGTLFDASNELPYAYTNPDISSPPPVTTGGAGFGGYLWVGNNVAGDSLGVGSIRIRNNGQGEAFVNFSAGSTVSGGKEDLNIDLRRSQSYVWSAYVYAGRDCTIQVYLRSAGGNTFKSIDITGGSWNRVSTVLDTSGMNADTAFMRVDTESTGSQYDVYFSKFQLEEKGAGDLPTRFKQGIPNQYPNQSKLQISSADFEAGVKGWGIFANGDCEFNNGTFRGTLDGADGVFSGTVRADRIDSDVIAYAIKSIAGGTLERRDGAGNSYKTIATGTIGASASTGQRTIVFPPLPTRSVSGGASQTSGYHQYARLQVKIGTQWHSCPSVGKEGFDGRSTFGLTGVNLPGIAIDVGNTATTYEIRIHIHTEGSSYYDFTRTEWFAQTYTPSIGRKGSSIT